MSIDRLRYFAAVVETGNLRKAAELVGISAPSMSKAIGVLEKEIGAKLTHAEGRGIVITPRGLEVYRLASPVLDAEARFQRQLRMPEVVGGTKLKIATFEVFSSYFLASFLAAKKKEKEEIFLLEMTPGKIEQAILQELVDFGITYIPSPDPELEYAKIGSFEMKIYGHKKWKNKPFSHWPFAVPTTEFRIHSTDLDALDMWPRMAPKRFAPYQFELLETALQTARKGLSVIHCPDFIVALHNKDIAPGLILEALPLPSGYRTAKATPVYLVAKKGSLTDDMERRFSSFFRNLR